MAEPRYKRFAQTAASPEEKAKCSAWPVIKRAFTMILIGVIIAFGGMYALRKVPFKSSVIGDYTPPASRGQIRDFSLARWFLHGAHEDQLKVSLAWYHSLNLAPAESVGELDSQGFRPFLFIDETGRHVTMLGAMMSVESNPKNFLLALIRPRGTSGGFISRRAEVKTNLLGDSWTEFDSRTVLVKPEDTISIHGQFLPETPQFSEQYVCFLAQVWEVAVASYIELYQRPPESIDQLMDGIGLVPNPDCAWPFGENESLDASCEGGLIDGKIVYWKVTLADGETRGQARYWDQYTSYDDANTPDAIITRAVTSEVVDPRYIQGTRQVMYTPGIVRRLLESVRPPESEEETPE